MANTHPDQSGKHRPSPIAQPSRPAPCCPGVADPSPGAFPPTDPPSPLPPLFPPVLASAQQASSQREKTSADHRLLRAGVCLAAGLPSSPGCCPLSQFLYSSASTRTRAFFYFPLAPLQFEPLVSCRGRLQFQVLSQSSFVCILPPPKTHSSLFALTDR